MDWVLTGRFKHDENKVDIRSVVREINDTLKDEEMQHPAHEFWSDSVSLLSDTVDWQKILSSSHLPDVYLLALATQQGGRFVTLARGIPLAAIAGAKAKNLLVLGGS